MAGQQFEYTFDWIGNRLSTAAGGDESGAGLRPASYTPNSLNQYTQRTVPTWVSVQGEASSNATVTVNLHREASSNVTVTVDVQPTKRHGDYFWTELWLNNSTGAVYQAMTNVAALRRTNLPDVVSSTVGSLFQPKTPELFQHDADGNLTNDGRWTLTWDAENRLVAIEGKPNIPDGAKKKVDCTYDYRSRRTQKTVSTWNGSAYVAQSTNRFLYDGWNLVAVLNGTNGLLYSFTWGADLNGSLQGAGGIGGLISMTVQSGTLAGTYFYCYDGNGNVVALVNAADGTLAAQYEYGAFGELIRATGPLAFLNPFRFSTKYQDDETGFLYYGYRYYNPTTGRWLSRDPLGEIGFELLRGRRSQVLNTAGNLYNFAKNQPVNLFDPSGLYDLQFDSFNGFTDQDKKDIANSISRTGGSATKLRDEAKTLLDKLKQSSCPCPKLQDELNKLIKIANKVINGVNSKSENLEIEQGEISGGTYALTTISLVPGYDPVLRFNNKSLDWHKAPQNNLGLTVLHELTHLYGTEDNDSAGRFMNAHTIEILVEGIEKHIYYKDMLRECQKAQKKAQEQKK